MATINTATHFGLQRELGSIAPGRRADLILTDDLRALPVRRVLARGVTVAKDGECLVDCPHHPWPAAARQTVRVGRRIEPGDFRVAAPGGANSVRARVIGVVENQAPPRALTADLPVEDGLVLPEGDVARVALVERHRGTGKVTSGFVSGFGYRGRMAIASTVAHDSHHMIVVGTSAEDMAAAANRLAEVGGGVTLYRDGREAALGELPSAGLLSDRPAAEVAAKARALGEALRAARCTMNNAFMQHSLLELVVIPELRISDLGLVDVTRFELTDVVEGTA
jgi:adenine deaminase